MSPEPVAVLDASAVLAWVNDERGGDKVEAALPRAAISAVNLAEVLYKVKEFSPGVDVEQLEADLIAYGLTVVPFTEEHAREIPRIRSAGQAISGKKRRVSGSLSLADCACIATALVLGIPAVTDDSLWGSLDLGRSFRAIPFR